MMVATAAERRVAARLAAVRRRIVEAAERADRDPAGVSLVGVTKTVDRAAVDAAYRCGLRHFGENRVQDALRKFAEPLPADAALHLIGQLQSNKARPAAGLFSIVESVDRSSLIDALGREAERRGGPIPALLQVNIAGESQKAGCAPTEAPALASRLAASPRFDLRGLMTIAPLVDDPERVRWVFAGLRALRDDLEQALGAALPVLSMGMSDDFPVAIAEGATHVRVGRAIFAE